MTAKRIIAAALAVIACSAIIRVSLSLRDSVSSLSILGAHVTAPEVSRAEPLASAATTQASEEESARATDGAPMPRQEISGQLREARECLDDRDFACTEKILNQLAARVDLTGSEMAQVLYFESALNYAQGHRDEAIRILREEIPNIADLADDELGWMVGMLSSILFEQGRDEEAFDAVNDALRLAPRESLFQLRERISDALNREFRSRRADQLAVPRPSDRLLQEPVDSRRQILLNEVVE